MSRTIDAHQHFWQRGRFKDAWLDEPKHKPISGSYLPEDLAPHLHQCGIDGSVFVQTQHDVDGPAEIGVLRARVGDHVRARRQREHEHRHVDDPVAHRAAGSAGKHPLHHGSA